jgi:hypothetical protein
MITISTTLQKQFKNKLDLIILGKIKTCNSIKIEHILYNENKINKINE